MKFRQIFRFEFTYQLRRVSTWILFALLGAMAYHSIKGNYVYDARNGDFFLNAPWVIAMITVLGSQLTWLVAAAIAGNAAARDVQTRMYPLTYTAPISKSDYLGGRFLAALALNALLLLALPAGILLGLHSQGVEAEILGPSRPAAYLSAYLFLALPDAFIAAAVQFSLAALSSRAAAGYVGSVLLTVTSRVVGPLMFFAFGSWQLANLLDPNGVIYVSQLLKLRTAHETNTLLIGLEGLLLWNRLLWIAIALLILAFTRHRFRFRHHAAGSWWSRIRGGRDAH